MKYVIIIILLSFTIRAYAEDKKAEKTIEFKAHIVKMMMTKDKQFRLELKEFAAAYHAEESFEPCLQQAMKEKSQALLKVSSETLFVQECTVVEKEKK